MVKETYDSKNISGVLKIILKRPASDGKQAETVVKTVKEK